jgi:hypothetical protein
MGKIHGSPTQIDARAGRHRFTAKLPGRTAAVWEVELSPRQQQSYVFKLGELSTAPAASAPAAPTTVQQPGVAVDAGNANGNSGTRIGAWVGAELISDGDTGLNAAPATLADPHGNAMAIRTQGDGDTSQFRYSRYTASAGTWRASDVITTGSYFYQGNAGLAADNGVVALLTEYYGSYTEEDPGQPFLNIFE